MRQLHALAFCAILLSVHVAQADEPAYMQIKVGQTAEIKGRCEKDGGFRAEEIELLPDSRRPKLRGTIDAVDTTTRAISVLGQWISVTSSTQFLDAADSVVHFSLLRPKGRVEVSCRIDSAGKWTARHLRIQNVKQSDKIKGTITRAAYDGHSPDTLVIEALRIIVTDKTQVFRTLGGSAEARDEQDSLKGPGQ